MSGCFFWIPRQSVTNAPLNSTINHSPIMKKGNQSPKVYEDRNAAGKMSALSQLRGPQTESVMMIPQNDLDPDRAQSLRQQRISIDQNPSQSNSSPSNNSVRCVAPMDGDRKKIDSPTLPSFAFGSSLLKRSGSF